MELNLESNRLILQRVTLKDYSFIKALVNTKGWIQFIGDRQIHSDKEAKNYIEKIINIQNIKYWVVTLKDQNTAIGIITFIKRDSLDFHDLGFAFLPEFGKNGYAYEATNIVLEQLKLDKTQQTILATTIPENNKSIQLLEKLGFNFRDKIENNGEILSVYLKQI
ncbi:GNAT family N-acetyltransferase [Flavobacterium sp.]|uniref:GNAT family N-acetyltransferase n=1 Tax=Flavobacterium sp. TaxID=239 RepID=UPI00286A01CB|nr:GNAT family N-acetyltransferase [Flavobacterium sp.]